MDQDLQPVDGGAPAFLRRGDERRVAGGRVDQVDHNGEVSDFIGVQRQVLERRDLVVEAGGRAVDQQLGSFEPVDRPSAEVSDECPRPLGCAVPHLDVCSTAVEGMDRGARAAACSEHGHATALDVRAERVEQSRRVGVVGHDLAVGAERQRVGGTDRPGALCRCRGQSERGLLVRDRDVRAVKARAGKPRHDVGEELWRRGEVLVAPVGEAQRRERRAVHARRAAVGDRPAEDAEARHLGRAAQHREGALPPSSSRLVS